MGLRERCRKFLGSAEWRNQPQGMRPSDRDRRQEEVLMTFVKSEIDRARDEDAKPVDEPASAEG
jgi:hypothetical protein